MKRKYEFTGETYQVWGVTLRRIKRLSDGLLGGFIEHEANLSHEGECFVFNNAQVTGDALVAGNAWVMGNARVKDNARVSDNAVVAGDAQVLGNALIVDNAQVLGNALIVDNVLMSGNARVSGDAQVAQNPICITGFRHNITITETHAFIGCEHHTLEHWTQFIEEIGTKHDYNYQDVIAIKTILNTFKLRNKV